MNLIDKVIRKIKPSKNERGNQVYQLHIGSGERYEFDFKICSAKNGWRQFDTSQDASYFGMWVHLERRLTVTFAEGDLTVVECPTRESFRAELKDAEEFYGDPPPMAVSINSDGTMTKFYDERPKV